MTRRTSAPPVAEKGAFERHAQSLVAAVILAVLLFVGRSVQEVKEQTLTTATEVAIFQKAVADKVATLQADITGIRQELSRVAEERVRSVDSSTRVLDLEARMRVLERESALNAAKK